MRKLAIIAIIAICVLAAVVGLLRLPSAGEKKSAATAENTIGLIRIEGVITGGRSGGSLFSGVTAGSDTIIEQLREVQKDKNLKVLVLRINSPGGSAPAAQEIGIELEKVKKSGKIVITSMGDVAASGGYWIAALTDKIVANPATMTGSIGVIMQLQNLQKLYDKIGIDYITFKSGPYKDIGNPDRPMTEEEKEIMQGMVDDIFDQFVDVVARGRKMDRQEVLKYATGQVFTGRQAKKIGLVDELGSYYDALDLAAKMAGIKGEYQIKEYGKKSPWEMFLQDASRLEEGTILRELLLAAGSWPLAPGD